MTRYFDLKKVTKLALWVCCLSPIYSYGQINQPKFPAHWGEPPSSQSTDFGPLPYGYGYGSSTLGKWIEVNVKLNRFPAEWGIAPLELSPDYVKLPEPFGYGSSTLHQWVLSKLKKEKLAPAASLQQANHLREWKPYPSPSPKPTPSATPRKVPPIRVYAW